MVNTYQQMSEGNLHFKNAISFQDASFVGRATFQNGTDMLQRGVKLAIDRTKLATFANLSAYIKAESRFGLDDFHYSRSCWNH